MYAHSYACLPKCEYIWGREFTNSLYPKETKIIFSTLIYSVSKRTPKKHYNLQEN